MSSGLFPETALGVKGLRGHCLRATSFSMRPHTCFWTPPTISVPHACTSLLLLDLYLLEISNFWCKICSRIISHSHRKQCGGTPGSWQDCRERQRLFNPWQLPGLVKYSGSCRLRSSVLLILNSRQLLRCVSCCPSFLPGFFSWAPTPERNQRILSC